MSDLVQPAGRLEVNKIGHVLGALHVPTVYNMGSDSLLKKTVWMTFLQMVSNLLLLVPLPQFILNMNVWYKKSVLKYDLSKLDFLAFLKYYGRLSIFNF